MSKPVEGARRATYKGEPVDEMSKKELIDALFEMQAYMDERLKEQEKNLREEYYLQLQRAQRP